MAGLKRNLPESVSDQNDKRRERKRLRAAMKAASDAYSALREMFNDSAYKRTVPEDLKELSNVRWVDNYIDKKLESLENIIGSDIENVLPQGQVAFLKKQWESKRTKAHEHVGTVASLLKEYPSGKFTTHNYQVMCENLDEVVESITAVSVDDVCKELFRLYANTTDDLARLNRYAKEHGFKEFEPRNIGAYKTPQEFAEMWNVGGFSINPSVQQVRRRIAESDDTPRLKDRNGNPIFIDH